MMSNVGQNDAGANDYSSNYAIVRSVDTVGLYGASLK